MSSPSLVYWTSSSGLHRCGYCKNEKGNLSDGMWAKSLTVEDYQNLIDRGWRRSGVYCYKPTMDEICCPMYTISCDSQNFHLSKSQKKVIKKVNKFLRDGQLVKNDQPQTNSEDGISEFVQRDAPRCFYDTKNDFSEDVVDCGNIAVEDNEQSTSLEHNKNCHNSEAEKQIKQALKQPKDGTGADPNKPPCKKAKLIRLERKQQKLLKRGMNLDVTKTEQKNLEDFLGDTGTDLKHKLKITIERIEKGHRYFQLTADLWAKYQIAVHNDTPSECNEVHYYDFLIDTPLQYVKFPGESVLGFGSFHQLYWLDDKLIAVGVIDILPKCVSAVYFFYDPDYRNLTLGTYGCLREVELARSLHKKVPSIQYYYMGYYIHSCPKMRYKGRLIPSYLLCPETYTWVPIEKCIEKLEVSKYSRFADREVDEKNAVNSQDVKMMRVLEDRKVVLLKNCKQKNTQKSVFSNIASLVGKKCCKSIIFITTY